MNQSELSLIGENRLKSGLISINFFLIYFEVKLQVI